MAFAGVLLRFGMGDGSMNIVLVVSGVLGAVLSASWYIVIRSYRQLNSGKFLALHEIEKDLPYSFFKREWDLLGEGKDRRRYWRLTIVETFLPIAFFLLFLFVTAIPFIQSDCESSQN